MRLAVALIVVGALSQVSAQTPRNIPTQAPPQFNPGNTEQKVTVEGCLYGTLLKPDLSKPTMRQMFDLLDVKELRLDGQKEVVVPLVKEHYGHQDETTGLLVVPGDKDVTVGTSDVAPRTRVSGGSSGPGKDTVGTVQTPSRTAWSQRWVWIKVSSLRHLADKCSFPG